MTCGRKTQAALYLLEEQYEFLQKARYDATVLDYELSAHTRLPGVTLADIVWGSNLRRLPPLKSEYSDFWIF